MQQGDDEQYLQKDRVVEHRVRNGKNIKGKPVSNVLFSLPFARRLVVSGVRRNFAGGTTFISGGAALDPAKARGSALADQEAQPQETPGN